MDNQNVNQTPTPATSAPESSSSGASSDVSAAFSRFETSPSGETVKGVRKALKLNQEQFADAIDVCQGLVSQVESGKVPVSKRLKAKLAELKSKRAGN